MSTDIKSTIVASITDVTNAANSLADEIRAATTDRTRLVHDYLNPEGEPADEVIAAFVEWRDKAYAAIEAREEKAREHVTAKYLTEVDESTIDAKKAEYRDLADKVKVGRKFFLGTIPGATEEDLKDVPDLKTLRGGTAGGGGAGGKRPRLQRIAYRTNTTEPWTEVSRQQKNANGEEVTVTSFTVLASELKSVFGTKVEVKHLQETAFEAAGTDDLGTVAGKVLEFAMSVGEQTVFIQIQPKATEDE